jgi:hypothetical protein
VRAEQRHPAASLLLCFPSPREQATVNDMLHPLWLDLSRAWTLRVEANQLWSEIGLACEALRRTRQFWHAIRAEEQRRLDKAIRLRLGMGHDRRG